MHNKWYGAFLALGFLYLSSLVLGCHCGATATADEHGNPGMWEKMVTREVEIAVNVDTVAHHLKDQSGDTSLAELLIRAVKAGKVKAYANTEPIFSNVLAIDDLDKMMAVKTDTIVVTDPVAGTNETKVVSRDFQFSSISDYRILEHWTLDPSTGQTSIQIAGIAPVVHFYTESYNGNRAMFWLNYNDAAPLIKNYERQHPDNTLSRAIWADYFQAQAKPVPVNTK